MGTAKCEGNKHNVCKCKRASVEPVLFGEAVAHVDIFGRIRSEAERDAIREFNQWRQKYEQVENAIYEARAKREAAKRRRADARKRNYGDLCEMTEGRAVLCERWNMSLEEVELLIFGKEAAGFWNFPEVALWRAKKVQEEATLQLNRLSHRVKRPFYYEREKARRQALAEERRKVKRRHTISACPTKEAILDAWIHVKDSNEALLHFGSLLQDLECYVDNELRRNEDGVIIGRNHGIKGWLQIELPALYLRYKTVMAYKAMAKKMRQLLELKDPIPLDAVLDIGEDNFKTTVRSNSKIGVDTNCAVCEGVSDRRKGRSGIEQKQLGELAIARESLAGEPIGRGRIEVSPIGQVQIEQAQIERARIVYREIVELMAGGKHGKGANARCTAAGLSRQIDALIKPECVEDGNMLADWKRKYRNEIMVRSGDVQEGVGRFWRKATS